MDAALPKLHLHSGVKMKQRRVNEGPPASLCAFALPPLALSVRPLLVSFPPHPSDPSSIRHPLVLPHLPYKTDSYSGQYICHRTDAPFTRHIVTASTKPPA